MADFSFTPDEVEKKPSVENTGGFSFTPTGDDTFDPAVYTAADFMAIEKGENVGTIEKIGNIAESFIKSILEEGMEYGQKAKEAYAGYKALDGKEDPFDLATTIKEPAKSLAKSSFQAVKSLGGLFHIAGDNAKLSPDQIASGRFPKTDVIFWDTLGSGLNKVGDVVQKYADMGVNWDLLEPDEKVFSGSIIENPSWARMLSIITGAVPSIAESVYIKKFTGSSTLAYALPAGIENSEMYEEAREAGKSVDEATNLFLLGTGGTMGFDLVTRPIDRILNIKTKTLSGKIGKVVTDASVEGTTEAFQQVWQNSVKKYGYDESQKLLDGTIESFIGGAGSGGMVSSFVTATGAAEYDANVANMKEQGLTDADIHQFQEVVANEIAQKREAVNPIIQENIDKSLKSFDEHLIANEEILGGENTRKELNDVYNVVYEELSANMPMEQAKHAAKMAQAMSFFGSRQLGITPMEYINDRFPKFMSENQQTLMDKRDFARDVEKLRHPMLIKKAPKPLSLSQYLKGIGGIRDEGGELAQMEVKSKRKGLVKEDGLGFDDAALAAWESGYFPDMQERPDINQFLDALSRDIDGKGVFSEFQAESEEAYYATMAEEFGRAGIDVTKPIDETFPIWQDYKAKNEPAVEEVAQYNAELDDFIMFQDSLNPLEITGKEFGEYTDDKSYIKQAKDWYNQNLKGTKASNPIIGDVNFYSRQFSETKDKNIKNIQNLKYLPAVKEIIETSRNVVEEVPNHERRDEVVKFYRIAEPVAIGNNTKQVSVIIAEDVFGNKYYTLEVKENSLQDTSVERGLKGSEVDKSTYNQSIADNDEYVNIEVKSIADAAKRVVDDIEERGWKPGYREAKGYNTVRKDVKPRGYIRFMEDGSSIVNLLSNADASTFIHEMGHFFLKELDYFAKNSTDPQAKARLEAVNKWLGNDGNGVYTREQQEKFADGFLTYVRTNKAPNNFLKQTFARFAEWLRGIIRTAAEARIELNPDIRRVYNDILGGKELDRALGWSDVLGEKNFDKAWEATIQQVAKEEAEVKKKFYDDNFKAYEQKQNRISKFSGKIKDNIEALHEWVSDAIIPLESEIMKISPEIALMNRRLEIAKLQRNKRYHEQIKGFIEGMEKLSKKEFVDLDLALKNRDNDKAMEIINRNNLAEEYAKVQALLEELYIELENVGAEVGYLEKYYPRRSNDSQGLLDFIDLKVTEQNKKLLEQAIIEREQRGETISEEEKKNLLKGGLHSKIRDIIAERERRGAVLSVEDKARIVNSLLRGYGGQITLANIGNVKSREIEFIDAELNKFYKNSADALADYVSGVATLLEEKKYFGRENKEISALRTRLMGRRRRIREYENLEPGTVKGKELRRLNYEIGGEEAKIRNALSEEDRADAEDRKKYLEGQVEYFQKTRADFVKKKVLERMNQEFEEVQKQVDEWDSVTIEQSVGQLVLDMVEDGKIDAAQEDRLRTLLTARFNEKGMSNNFLKSLRDGGYLATLGNFESAITQLGDLAVAAYEAGLWNAGSAFVDAVKGKSKITKEMLNLDKTIVREMSESETALAKILDKTLGITGFEKIDRLGKETLANAAITRMRKEAIKNDPKLNKYLEAAYQENAEKVRQDLADGKITPEIAELAMFKLMDYQPLTIDQMPRFYVEGGNKRLFYSLKSYMLRQLDIARKIIFEKGKTDPKGAIKDMMMLSMYMMLFNAGADLLKDLIFGRKIDIPDTIADNMFMGGIFNKYTVDKFKRGGAGSVIKDMLFPPIVADTLTKEIFSNKDVKDFRAWANLPVVGRFYYWYFGGGAAKKEKEDKKERNQVRKKQRKRRER